MPGYIRIVLLALSTVASGASLAGARNVYPVQVDQERRSASGGLRNDNPAVLGVIRCHAGPALEARTANTSSGGCLATAFPSPSLGVVGSCFTSNSEHLATIRSLNEDSYVSFFWDTNGNCTSVTAITGSLIPPAIGTTQVDFGPVVINNTQNWARGDVASTRNSSDNLQWLQCWVRAQLGVPTTARCSAQMADGTRADCDTTNATHLRNIGTLTAVSQLYFAWTNETPLVASDGTVLGVLGTCSAVRVENSTLTPTKLP